ncbi:hypothetical protein PR048_020316 [Dryococelus australis]|uniref:Uncharacterized protein n=1 Tax=Dryococelus australis TaxID=614101 RepID=A0ABQ9H5Y3_9NEOP|nr:hypothetical protein PR048_020316 [Dryococelus australis]
MEQRRNERMGKTGDHRENSPTNGIVRHESYTRPGIEPGSLCWEASELTARPPPPLTIAAVFFVIRRSLRQSVHVPGCFFASTTFAILILDLSFFLMASRRCIVSFVTLLYSTTTWAAPEKAAPACGFRQDHPDWLAGRPRWNVSLLASYQGEPVSIIGGVARGYSHVGSVSDDAAGRRIFSESSRFPRPCIPTVLHTHFPSLSLVFKTSTAVEASIVGNFSLADRGDDIGAEQLALEVRASKVLTLQPITLLVHARVVLLLLTLYNRAMASPFLYSGDASGGSSVGSSSVSKILMASFITFSSIAYPEQVSDLKDSLTLYGGGTYKFRSNVSIHNIRLLGQLAAVVISQLEEEASVHICRAKMEPGVEAAARNVLRLGTYALQGQLKETGVNMWATHDMCVVHLWSTRWLFRPYSAVSTLCRFHLPQQQATYVALEKGGRGTVPAPSGDSNHRHADLGASVLADQTELIAPEA